MVIFITYDKNSIPLLPLEGTCRIASETWPEAMKSNSSGGPSIVTAPYNQPAIWSWPDFAVVYRKEFAIYWRLSSALESGVLSTAGRKQQTFSLPAKEICRQKHFLAH